MIALRLTPAALALLVLAAHFLRRGAVLPMGLCIAVVLLLFVRRPWVPSVAAGALALAAFEWVRTLVVLVSEREAQGEPTGRLVAIMGGVTLFTLLAMLAFLGRRVREHYAPPAST